MDWGISSLVRHICWQPMGACWRISSCLLGATSCLSPKTHIHCAIGQPASHIQKAITIAALSKRKERRLATPAKTSVYNPSCSCHSLEELRTSKQSDRTCLSAGFRWLERIQSCFIQAPIPTSNGISKYQNTWPQKQLYATQCKRKKVK